MARQARKKSTTGFYHTIARGVGDQTLFACDEDYRHFLDTFKLCQDAGNPEIHAYCLMPNHVHLLLMDLTDDLDLFMKKLTSRYALYYNHKYARRGPLFRDRFLSEPIDEDEYFTVVLRHILQNPQTEGLGPWEDYPWSSYRELIAGPERIQTDFSESFFDGQESLLRYLRTPVTEPCMEIAAIRPDDDQARKILQKYLRGKKLQDMPKKERDTILRRLKENGLSIRQIERLTGVNRGVVQIA